MTTIRINSQHRANLNLYDIQKIKNNTNEGDTVKFNSRSIFGKKYTVTKSTDGEVSLKIKESKNFLSNFF